MSELVQLCNKWKAQYIGDWYMSEKLDGMRAFWDGGITRGLPKAIVPWADCRADGRLLKQPISTGLWTRLGGVIHAPDWWLNLLPPVLLDGELWMGYEHREKLMETVKTIIPGEGWKTVEFKVFDTPPAYTIFMPRPLGVGAKMRRWGSNGELALAKHSAGHFDHIIKVAQASTAQSSVPIGTDAGAQDAGAHDAGAHCANDAGATLVHGIPLLDNHGRHVSTVPMQSRFDSRLKWLAQRGIPFHTQKQLPIVGYAGVVEAAMELVLSKGGEGLVLKKNDSLYETCRSCWMLKYKPFSDDEGIVVGTTPGLGRLQGMIGALVVNWKGRQFELAGLTDVERSLGADKWIGRKVTFKYRTLTRDGLPSEARYWRDRTELE